MGQKGLSEDRTALSPEELVRRAQDSLKERLIARRVEVREELERGIEAVRAELEPIVSHILGRKLPKEFSDLLDAMEQHEELASFVTPEIKMLRDRFQELIEETNGGKPVRRKKEAVRRSNSRKENGQSADAARERDEELDERDQIILARARKDGSVKNDLALRQALKMHREGALMRLKKLVKRGLLERGEEEGQAHIVVFTIPGKRLTATRAARAENVEEDSLDETDQKIMAYAREVGGEFKNNVEFGEKMGLEKSSLFLRLRKLVVKGLLKKSGKAKGTKYAVAEKVA